MQIVMCIRYSVSGKWNMRSFHCYWRRKLGSLNPLYVDFDVNHHHCISWKKDCSKIVNVTIHATMWSYYVFIVIRDSHYWSNIQWQSSQSQRFFLWMASSDSELRSISFLHRAGIKSTEGNLPPRNSTLTWYEMYAQVGRCLVPIVSSCVGLVGLA